MAISKNLHGLHSYGYYPRAYYFHKRGLDLYQRFKQLIAVFPKGVHINEQIDEIDRDIKSIEKPPKLLVYGNGDLDLTDLVVSMDPQDDPVILPYKGPGTDIVILYVEIDKADTVGIQTVENVIQSYREDLSEVKDRIFMVCKINTENTQVLTGFQQTISSLLQEHFHLERPLDDHIILCPNDKLVKERISEYFERSWIVIFDKIRNYLKRFLTSVKGQIQGHVLDDETVIVSLRAFVGNECNIKDIIDKYESDIESGMSLSVANLPAEERYLIFICDELVKVLICIISKPLSVKNELPLWLCSDMLTEFSSKEKFSKSLSNSTKSFMKRLFKFRDNKSGYEDLNPVTRRHEYIVDKIKLDLSKTMQEVEGLMKSTKEMTFIMEKMVFEIGGYFRQSNIEMPEVRIPRQPNKTYIEMKRHILEVDCVFGVGTVYGQLEIHLAEDNSDSRSAVKEILQKHGYSRPFRVKIVDKLPGNFADMQHEHGKTIYTPIEGQERKGTLGGFVENAQKELYMLTCAHVVRGGLTTENFDVHVEESRTKRKIGTSTAPMSLYPGEVPMIDIAAVKVVDDIKDHCVKFMKDEAGLNRLSKLARTAQSSDFESLNVFKFGAATNLTNGLVCSRDYMIRATQELGLPGWIMLIESLPASTKPFAVEGDSGSVVCLQTPGSKILTALSMLSMGDFKLQGDNSTKCFTFMLQTGLEEMFRKSNEQLFLCTL